MPDPSSLALPHVATLHAYTPGLQPTEPGWVKLNTNECPYPPSPRVAEALAPRNRRGRRVAAAVSESEEQAAARRGGEAARPRDEENVCIGNGSDDILKLLVRAFCTRGGAAGFTVPSYSLYPVLVEIQDGRSRR